MYVFFNSHQCRLLKLCPLLHLTHCIIWSDIVHSPLSLPIVPQHAKFQTKPNFTMSQPASQPHKQTLLHLITVAAAIAASYVAFFIKQFLVEINVVICK